MRRTFLGAGLVAGAVIVATAAAASALSSSDVWHLDRINQRSLPVDGNTSMPAGGAGIDIYVVDGQVRSSHTEFTGRALAGWDAVAGKRAGAVEASCAGHGTHVAALAAGREVGVAAGARVIPVRALGCDGAGEIASLESALGWIARHHRSGRLAVVNLSLGVSSGLATEGIATAVQALLDDGLVVVAAAGNDSSSTRACSIAPANLPSVVTVGAVDTSDARSPFSNHGSCVDIFAPGGGTVSMLSAWITGDSTYRRMNGTSMASPLVAGYAALLAAAQPGLCPAQVGDAILDRATADAVTGIAPGTPNRLLYLDTSAIGGSVAPGRPTEVIASADHQALRVSWDAPCNGGEALSGFTVTVRRGADVVSTLEVPGGERSLRIGGLTNGTGYSVSVRARNVVGDGPESSSTPEVAPLRVRRGTTVRVSSIIREAGGAVTSVKVADGSRGICSVRTAPLRIVAKAPGRCRLKIRSRHAANSVTRVLRVF